MAWEIFRNMTPEDDIKTLTYDISPTGSEEEEQQGGEGEATSDLEEQEGKKEETKIEEEKAKETEQGETKQIETEKETEGGEKGAEKTEVSPKTLEREAAAPLTALSTPIKPKQERKRQTLMYFRARKSTRTKTGKPQPTFKVPIIIEDSPSTQGKESPSKAPITYERGTPRSPTWK